MPSLLVFVGAGLALNLTPGPDMLYVIGRTVAAGRKAGVASALGIGAGTLVHVALVAGGVAGVLQVVPGARPGLQLLGALYLMYLGARVLIRPTAPQQRALPPLGMSAVFRQGMLTNVLNPKVAIFFLAFLPQFVAPGRGHLALQLLVLGLIFDINGTLVNLGVVLVASRAATGLGRRERAAVHLEQATGVLFIALGLWLAWNARS